MATSKKIPNLPSRYERLLPAHTTCGYRIDPSMPLHQLAFDRFQKNRDLKVVITAKDAQTGTGKTTLAFWLADQWQQLFRDEPWYAEKHATLEVWEYLRKYRNSPEGTVLILDEAEALDARRSNAHENVQFSHYWMKMRVRQVMSILTLPSTTALDSRVEELADVWIEVVRRGKALVHDIRVNSYDKSIQTWKVHNLAWPDVSSHHEMQALDKLKEVNIDEDLQQDEQEAEAPDPDEIRRQQKIETAQNMRGRGLTIAEIAENVDMSEGWVSNNTEAGDN